MEAIKETLKTVFNNLQARSEGALKDNPEVLLKKILSKRELAHVRVGYFRKGILGIKVNSSSWLYYLNLQKTDLLDKLRRKSSAVKEVRFSLGDF